MQKTIEQWLLFKYIGGEFTPLSKPFKKKQLAEKARLKYPPVPTKNSVLTELVEFRQPSL
jgi:hypothetical protein